MKKIFLFLILLILVVQSAFGEIKVKVHKNMTFENINARNTGRDVLGVGILEITCEQEDLGNWIRLDFLKKGYITNKKNWIEIKKFHIEEKDKIFKLDSKTKHIKFYGVIDRNSLGKNIDNGDLIEGKYVGATPILLSIYEKELIE